jgi:hypothetical protein
MGLSKLYFYFRGNKCLEIKVFWFIISIIKIVCNHISFIGLLMKKLLKVLFAINYLKKSINLILWVFIINYYLFLNR